MGRLWIKTFVNEIYELVDAIQEGREPEPGFEVGVQVQGAGIEAVETSMVERRWVDVQA